MFSVFEIHYLNILTEKEYTICTIAETMHQALNAFNEQVLTADIEIMSCKYLPQYDGVVIDIH